jgi:DNA polymerase-3 subunit gamma/tau
MEQFVVSARKYRPQTFNDVVGQRSDYNTLNTMTGCSASAFWWSLALSCGKKQLARVF